MGAAESQGRAADQGTSKKSVAKWKCCDSDSPAEEGPAAEALVRCPLGRKRSTAVVGCAKQTEGQARILLVGQRKDTKKGK